MEAARQAFPDWAARSPQERAQVLNKVADLLEQSLEELAQAESKDQGESRGTGRVGLTCDFSLAQPGLGAGVSC